MKLQPVSFHPDLYVFWNNSFLFVVPVPGGKLEGYARPREQGLAGWLFYDERHLPNPNPAHIKGTTTEGERFVDLCQKKGMVAAEMKMKVPCSSGPARRGEFAGYYSPDELALSLVGDLPSLDEFAELARVS